MAGYADDLALSHVLADAADAVSMARFRALDLRVDAKPDLTPVSDADTAVERALRGTLSRARPRDGVLGEEFGATDAPAGPGSRVWVIDPIDGTKNYIRGVPIWGTLIALMEGDQAMVGMVSAPALGRRWGAARWPATANCTPTSSTGSATRCDGPARGGAPTHRSVPRSDPAGPERSGARRHLDRGAQRRGKRTHQSVPRSDPAGAGYPPRVFSAGWLYLAAMIVAYGVANLLQSMAAARTSHERRFHPSLLLRLA